MGKYIYIYTCYLYVCMCVYTHTHIYTHIYKFGHYYHMGVTILDFSNSSTMDVTVLAAQYIIYPSCVRTLPIPWQLEFKLAVWPQYKP